MHIKQQLRSRQTRANPGLTYVEVMIATFVLVVIAITNLELFTSFGKSFLESRQRDSIQSLIINDLAGLRRLVQSYCRHDDDALADCTGSFPVHDKDGSYNPDSSSCTTRRLAVAMEEANPTHFPSTATLDPGASANVLAGTIITRRITPAGNELKVFYTTNSESKVQVQMSTSMIPPALGWCP